MKHEGCAKTPPSFNLLLSKFKSRPRGYLGILHLLKLHDKKWVQKAQKPYDIWVFRVGIYLGCTICEGAIKKIFSAFYLRDLNPRINHGKAVYIINAQHCISPKRSFAYHQAAGKCTLMRDEIQGRLAALDDIHDCAVMICQACGLDKKTTGRNLSFFGCGDGIKSREGLSAILRANTQNDAVCRHCGVGHRPRQRKGVALALVLSKRRSRGLNRNSAIKRKELRTPEWVT